MCGIAGSVGKKISEWQINECCQLLKNRGPDGIGVISQSDLTLIHTRLSIIDLSKFGNQPMSSNCGRYTIVFNGEIYNHEEIRNKLSKFYDFRSKSDTEVILASFLIYGIKCISDFRGMFAFAIWDNKKKEIFIARDRLGVKPLFFSHEKFTNSFVFASTPKALFSLLNKSNKDISKQAIRFFLESGYIPAPYSIYENIHKLEPGHYLIFDGKNVIKNKYWSFENIQINYSLAFEKEVNLLDELDSLIAESVKLRMVSDVPIGAFLSGGIDSSLVVAYMTKISNSSVRTFNIGFQEKSFDESYYAKNISEFLGTQHKTRKMSAESLLNFMPSFESNFDEPFFDYAAFPFMAVSELAKETVKVSLSGDGGDESFGGYHYYNIMRHIELLCNIPSYLLKPVERLIRITPFYKLRWLCKALIQKNPYAVYAFIRSVIKDNVNVMNKSLKNETYSLADLFEKKGLEYATELNYSEIGMRLDTSFILPDDYLQKIDLGSMAFSLEVREPLLDHKIVEWANKLPYNWKYKNGNNKYLLRKLLYRYLPKELVERPKMGFEVPVSLWLESKLKPWADSLLRNKAAFEALELDWLYINKLWEFFLKGKKQFFPTLWSVFILIQFYEKNFHVSSES